VPTQVVARVNASDEPQIDRTRNAINVFIRKLNVYCICWADDVGIVRVFQSSTCSTINIKKFAESRVVRGVVDQRAIEHGCAKQAFSGPKPKTVYYDNKHQV
jgi:hypothetical protein